MIKKLIVIDGNNFLWRAFSVPFQFYSPKGTPLHVVTTFLKLIRRSINAVKDFGSNDSLIIVFDVEGRNSNHELSSDYKANRKTSFNKDEDSPFQHLHYVKKVLDYLGIPYLEKPGLEADDVIATVTKRFLQDNTNNAYIFSSDTDFYQLLNERVSIIKLKPNNSHELIDSRYLEKRYGVQPNEYVYFKSLTGDKTDNIEGIKGIGPITAKKILRKEVEFDKTPYTELLELNNKLITLDGSLNLELNKDYSFKPLILDTPNNTIFNDCGF